MQKLKLKEWFQLLGKGTCIFSQLQSSVVFKIESKMGISFVSFCQINIFKVSVRLKGVLPCSTVTLENINYYNK